MPDTPDDRRQRWPMERTMLIGLMAFGVAVAAAGFSKGGSAADRIAFGAGVAVTFAMAFAVYRHYCRRNRS